MVTQLGFNKTDLYPENLVALALNYSEQLSEQFDYCEEGSQQALEQNKAFEDLMLRALAKMGHSDLDVERLNFSMNYHLFPHEFGASSDDVVDLASMAEYTMSLPAEF